MRLSPFLLFVLVLLVACAQPSPPAATGVPTAAVSQATAGPAPTAFVLPTLYPTATPPPTPLPTETRPPQPTVVPPTPVPFDQVVVELRYALPAIGLDRRLQGNVAGRLTLADLAAGTTETRSNQGSILLELQQALAQVELAPLPEGCDLCVQLEYELPLADRASAGWLQDKRLLASLENFTSVLLGPHFPPETVLGLRRSATPYDVAHTLALTADGQLWTWLATEEQLSVSQPVATVAPGLPAELDALAVDDLDATYAAGCEGAAIETLYLSLDGQEAPERETKRVRIVCPELVLPSTLLPLYLQIDQLLAEKLAGQGLPRPEPLLPLDSLLYYRDGQNSLTLYQDGYVAAVDAGGRLYTDTLPVAGITFQDAISLTAGLLASGRLEAGVAALTVHEAENILVVRGPEGVFSAGWSNEAEAALRPTIRELERLLSALVTATP